MNIADYLGITLDYAVIAIAALMVLALILIIVMIVNVVQMKKLKKNYRIFKWMAKTQRHWKIL